MKNKQEQAMVLLESLEQVNESMLLQAHTTDTPEAFRALTKEKPIPSKPTRQGSALGRWGAVAACLALILALAASPWVFSSLLPAITPPGPTPPPTTTDPTEPPDRLEPPELHISNRSESIQSHMVGGNWGYTWFDGHNAAELLELGQMPWLTTEFLAILEFDIEPTGFEVHCWPADQPITTQGKEVTVNNGMLQLQEGSYIYEVTASWENRGRISYVFAVTASYLDADCEFTLKSGEYLWPSMLYDRVEADTLNTSISFARIVCFTEYVPLANHFVAHQQQLLEFLPDTGVYSKTITCYAVDYGDSFSISDNTEAYIDWSAVGTWQQVMVTLQAFWGDYTNYGYVYAMANAIAEELGWETDSFAPMEPEELDAFIANGNLGVIHLAYPAFTAEYASKEVIRASKTLSCQLFEQLEWKDALKIHPGDQIWTFTELISEYAKRFDITYTRLSASFAYCSERIPLKINASVAECYVESGYVDGNKLFKDAFSDYANIYETANHLSDDLWQAYEDWQEIYTPEKTPIYFVSKETADKRFGTNFRIRYTEAQYGEATYTQYLALYMYGYYKHILYQFNPSIGQVWQQHAFVELGRAASWFAQYAYEVQFANDEASKQYFQTYAGHTYEPGMDDYFEWMDIMCYINEYFTVAYAPLGTPASMGWYLTKQYGEEMTFDLLLHPETVEAKTGKTWKELEAEWAQHIQDKYTDVVPPEN